MIDREQLELLCRRSVSVISNSCQHRRRLLIIGGLILFSILMFIPMLFHHSRSLASHSRESLESVKYRDALAENLARLSALRPANHEPRNPVLIAKTQISEPKHSSSKADRVRQNAPTRAFVLKGSPGSAIAHGASGSAFLDKSPYSHFANHQSHFSSIEAERIAHPAYTIAQGEFIHAILETAVNSDLPGMIRATIARPVYSYSGDRLLIPQGSRLIGQYSSQTLQGINRVMVVWQRIILPDGVSVQIDSSGSDALGEAGFTADDVNRHFIERFSQASLMSLIGAVVSNDNPTQEYKTAIAQSFQSSAKETLDRAISVKPTLRVNQGSRVIVFVARDLDFYGTRGGERDVRD